VLGKRICRAARLIGATVVALAVAATVALAAPNQFVILSDMHPARGAEPQLALLLEQLVKLKPAFVITLGDMDGDPEPDAGPDDLNHAVQLLRRLRQAGIEVHPTIGNHDGSPKIRHICQTVPPMNAEFDPAVNPEVADRWCGEHRFWYSFNRGGIHFATINSNVGPSHEQYEKMRQWMERDLCEHAINPNRFPTLLFMHHPEYMTGDRGYTARPAHALLSRCLDHTVAAVFAGHWHYTQYFPPEGNAGVQVYSTEASAHLQVDNPEYIVATVHPDKITFDKVDTKTGGPGKTPITYYPIPGEFTSLDDHSQGPIER
jgi:hypothetical protein